MTEKTGYKFSIKANQSLSSGMIGLEAYYAFDGQKDFDATVIPNILKAQEQKLTKAGYKLCSLIPNNMEQASKRTQEKLGGIKGDTQNVDINETTNRKTGT